MSTSELSDFLELSWTEVLLGLGIFIVASAVGLIVAGFLLAKLPANYFCDSHPRDFWVNRHPIVRWTGRVVKNLLGVVVIFLSGVLSLPGVPGPGILTILIGVTLLDFPGKRRLERWLVGRPTVLSAINRLRQRYHMPPLILTDGLFEPGRAEERYKN